MSVSFHDVGQSILVSDDKENWNRRVLARAAPNINEDGEVIGTSFVCWIDDEPSCQEVEVWPYAKLLQHVSASVRTPEAAFVSNKKLIEEHEGKAKELKAHNIQLASIIQELWAADGTSAKEVQLDGRCFKLSVSQKFDCTILKDNRESVKEFMRGIGEDSVIVEDVNTTKLKAWLVESAEQNIDGSYDMSHVPQELQELLNIYQVPVLSATAKGIRAKA